MDMTIETVNELSLLKILSQNGWFGNGILLVLFVFSVIAWAIIIYKSRTLKMIKKESDRFLQLYHENSDLGEVYAACVAFRMAPMVRIFKAGYLDLQRIRKEIMTVKTDRKTNIELAFNVWMEDVTSVLMQTLSREVSILESFLIFLAVTSSAAPLLGLLGTVWGILFSFWSIGTQGQTSLAVLAPGISAALTTTVGGLLTAIPAVVAYNSLANRVKILASEMECFASEFTGAVRRELRKAL